MDLGVHIAGMTHWYELCPNDSLGTIAFLILLIEDR